MVAINVDSYAARFALSEKMQREKHGKNNAIGLFHIGSEYSHFSVLVNRATVYERELGLGNQKLKQDLQRYTDDMQAEIIQPFNEMLAQELNRSLQLFFSSSNYTQVEYLYLAGDACHLTQLVSLLSQRIDMPVLLANPFLDMKFSSRVNQSILESQAPVSLVAVGLALSGMEL